MADETSLPVLKPSQKMGIFEKIKRVLRSPKEFFEKVKHETGLKSPFIYFIVLSLFSTIMAYVVGNVYMAYIPEKIGSIATSGLVDLQSTFNIINMVILYISSFVWIFVTAALVQVFAILFGSKEKYESSFKASVYSGTPYYIFFWIASLITLMALMVHIPFAIIAYIIIILALGLWVLYLGYKGISILHGLSEWRSFFAYIIPGIIIYLIMGYVIPLITQAIGIAI